MFVYGWQNGECVGCKGDWNGSCIVYNNQKVYFWNRANFRDQNWTIIHIAIYLGNDQVIEAWPGKVVVWPIKNSHRDRIAGVRRVFN